MARWLDRTLARVRAARSRWPWLDHAVRAYDRNNAVQGSQLAAAITYFGFLSFFPLLALAFAGVGFVSGAYPGAQQSVTDAVESAFPGLIGSGPGHIDVNDVIDARATAGVIGLVGMFYTGLGWLDALRDALRRVFGTFDRRLSFFRRKALDVVVLLGLGLALLASLAMTSFATAVTREALGLVDLEDSLVAVGLLKVVSVGLALAGDTVLFAIVIGRLSRAGLSLRQVGSGALLAAVGFEVLKLLGTFLLAHTTQNPVYATFGVVVGLAVWINFVSRLLVLAAAWTATGSYSLEPAAPGEEGSGRSTGLAVATEPVSVVVPPAFTAVPSPGPGSVAPRRGGWMRTLLGVAVGAAVVCLLRRRRTASS